MREFRGIDGLADELALQRTFFEGPVPVYHRTLQCFERVLDGEIGERLQATWADRVFRAPYERPLLLLAGLRFEALGEGPAHPLHDALVADRPKLDAVTDDALARATSAARLSYFEALRTRAIQTNETSRAVAWLWPAHLLSRAGVATPLALFDLGASAGLNLVADDLSMPWTDEQGSALTLWPRPRVQARHGLDLSPLDALEESSARWLRACVWPGETARLERLERALAAFAARASGQDRAAVPTLHSGSLANVGEHLRGLPESCCVLAFQTIVRDYLPPDVRERFEASMDAFLRTRPARSGLYARLELAPDAPSAEQMAALEVRFTDARGELRQLVLARTHAHPKKLFVREPAVAEFLAAFAGAG